MEKGFPCSAFPVFAPPPPRFKRFQMGTNLSPGGGGGDATQCELGGNMKESERAGAGAGCCEHSGGNLY